MYGKKGSNCPNHRTIKVYRYEKDGNHVFWKEFEVIQVFVRYMKEKHNIKIDGATVSKMCSGKADQKQHKGFCFEYAN